MAENQGLLSSGWSMVGRNKRYIVWFFLLNLLLGLFGTVGFFTQAGTILDHSLKAKRLVDGFDVGVYGEMVARPEFGPIIATRLPAIVFAVLFLLSTALFLPGVLQGYASTYRLPREDFFRACGRNLWRFIRLLIVAGFIFLIATGALFGLQGALVTKAGESTNEMLSFYVSMASLAVIFLVMSVLRIWFDLAQADVVLSDQRAVRKSIGKAFRHTWRGLGRLLTSYVVATIVAAIVLLAGLWVWMTLVRPASVAGAFLVSQLTLLLLLVPRFWQRGVAVTYYQRHMVEPIAVHVFTPVPVVEPVVAPPVGEPVSEPVTEPAAESAIPIAPPETQAS
jgi:hypothetical protein